ncbi:hypothetical protein J4E86_011808 [Alternaria arbusti]|uniref:uncharacterized protein n=1 Tax=Alternaria arbusti TaxID=232088 RepID=UPI00221E551F|nr:uncharacterized protein J4E86_011808 [Alternaria arbusti]KAI4925706.1 hypothetical protein J4E86_011808 [Alternaria arbusti]
MYEVRYKIQDLSQYGPVQKRKRVPIMAASPSGKRHFTPRELSLWQSFPYLYPSTGAQGEAKKQIGNAVPPCKAQPMYQNIAMSPKVFERGLVEAEDIPSNVDAILGPSGESIPQQRRLDSITGSANPFQTFSDPQL